MAYTVSDKPVDFDPFAKKGASKPVYKVADTPVDFDPFAPPVTPSPIKDRMAIHDSRRTDGMNNVQRAVASPEGQALSRQYPSVGQPSDVTGKPVEVHGQKRDYQPIEDLRKAVPEIPKSFARGLQNIEGAVGSAIEASGDYIDTQKRQWNAIFHESPIGKVIAARRRKEAYDNGYVRQDTLRAGEKTVGQKVSSFGEDVYDFWREAANTGWEKRDPKVYEGSFMENPSLTRIVGGAGESAPTMIGALALTAGGAPNMGLALLTASETLPIYTEAKRKGASEGDAFSYALLSGIGTAALERVGINSIMGKNPAVNKLIEKMGQNWVAGALVNFSVEGSQEALQEMWQNAVAMGYDDDRKVFDGAIEAGITGGILGGGTSVGVTVMRDYMDNQADNAKDKFNLAVDKAVIENMRPENAQIKTDINPLDKSAIDAQKTPTEGAKQEETAQTIGDALERVKGEELAREADITERAQTGIKEGEPQQNIPEREDIRPQSGHEAVTEQRPATKADEAGSSPAAASKPVNESLTTAELPESVSKDVKDFGGKRSDRWVLEDVSVNELWNKSVASITKDAANQPGYEYDFNALKKDIRDNGLQTPIVMVRNADGSIDAEGKHRIYIAHELGLDTIKAYVKQQPPSEQAPAKPTNKPVEATETRTVEPAPSLEKTQPAEKESNLQTVKDNRSSSLERTVLRDDIKRALGHGGGKALKGSTLQKLGALKKGAEQDIVPPAAVIEVAKIIKDADRADKPVPTPKEVLENLGYEKVDGVYINPPPKPAETVTDRPTENNAAPTREGGTSQQKTYRTIKEALADGYKRNDLVGEKGNWTVADQTKGAQKSISGDKNTDTSQQVKVDKPQDIEAQGKEKQSGGYVSVPDRAGVNRAIQQVGRSLMRNFTRMQGMDADTYNAQLEREHNSEAAIVSGQATRTAFKAARKTLVSKHGKDTIQKAMQDVVYGEMSVEDFSRQFGINKNHVMVKALSEFNKARKENSEMIAHLLEEQGANPELIENIRDNDFYVSRFYMKHLMGEQFTPDKSDYDAATREIQAGIEDAIVTLTESANKLRGKTKKTFADPVKYMQTRNSELIAHLSPSRQEKMQRLANKFDKLNQVIESVMYDKKGDVVVRTDSDKLLDAAMSTVDFYLNRKETGAGSVDTSHLKKRFLQGAFRSLYQEVKDPLFAASSTIEAQEQLIANLLMFNTLVAKGEGKSWSDMPSRKLGTEIQLGKDGNISDRIRYGKLAGKFVTKELHDAIIGGTPPPKALQYIWNNPIGVMRGLKLLGIKTIGRNYTEAYVGFAMANGDALRKGYGKNYARASRLQRDILFGGERKAQAKKELADLIKKGVFSLRGSTQAEEVLNLLSTSPKIKLANWFRKTMEAYSLIDFPTKVASYYTALDRGMTEAQAIEHVRKFYQNPDSIPKISQKVSKLGVTDYIGYRIDAIRIRANQVKYAVEQAKKGDLVPLVGLTMSASLDTARRGALIALWGNAVIQVWAQIQKAFMDDDENMEKAELIEKSREVSLREFMPPWYQDAPIAVWEETMKDGTKKMYYSSLGGNSAFPIEDLLYGAYMAEENKADVPGRVMQNLFTENMRGSMYMQSVYKMLTGDSMPNIPELASSLAKGDPPDGTFQSKGFLDVINGSDIKKTEIIRESILNFGLEVYGGQIGPKIQQTRAIKRRNAGDTEPRAGTYTPYRSVKETWMSLINPTRTYAIDKNEATRLVRNSLLLYREGLRTSKGAVSEREEAVKNLGQSTDYLNKWADRGQEERYKLLKRSEGLVATAKNAFGDMISDKEYYAILRDGMGMSETEARAVMLGKIDSLPEYNPKLRKTALERVNSK